MSATISRHILVKTIIYFINLKSRRIYTHVIFCFYFCQEFNVCGRDEYDERSHNAVTQGTRLMLTQDYKFLFACL